MVKAKSNLGQVIERAIILCYNGICKKSGFPREIRKEYDYGKKK
jgi:hypothetical protein